MPICSCDSIDEVILKHEHSTAFRQHAYDKSREYAIIEGTVLIAGCLALSFGWDRWIRRRADQIIAAARRLETQDPPAAPLKGSDELSKISKALHDAHCRLNEQAASLQAGEERYRRMVETMPAMVLVHRGGAVEYANPAAVRLLGAGRADQLIGRAPLDFVHPDFRETVLSRINELRERGHTAAPTRGETAAARRVRPRRRGRGLAFPR